MGDEGEKSLDDAVVGKQVSSDALIRRMVYYFDCSQSFSLKYERVIQCWSNILSWYKDSAEHSGYLVSK